MRQAAPGWYPNGGVERWWDGQQWTHQTRTIQAAAPRKAVTWVPHQTHPTFHLIMTLLTCGLWLPIWLIIAIVQSITRRKVVTRYR